MSRLREVVASLDATVDRFLPPNQAFTGKRNLGILFVLCAAVIYLAYFRRFADFGFYGDDAIFFGEAINRSGREAWDHFVFCLTRWPQGRPLGTGLNLGIVPYLISQLGPLSALHCAAWVILALNMLAVFKIVAKFADSTTAFAAAIFYGLCPAHTVRGQLTYAYGQISILCSLGTIYAGMSRRWIWYGLGVAVAMTMAETTAVAALVTPILLTLRPNWKSVRHASILGAIWIAMVGIILVVRKSLGDPWGPERVGEITAKPLETLVRSWESCHTGTATHFQLILERMALPLKQLDAPIVLTMVATMAICLCGVYLIRRAARPPAAGIPVSNLEPQPVPADAPATGKWHGLWLMFTGIVVMAAIYAAYFRSPWHPANWRTGFMSGVHLVPTLGASLALAGLSLLLGSMYRRHRVVLQTSLLLVAFALLAGFGVLVQRDYAACWAYQREFWKAYRDLCPDVGDRAFVLVLDHDPQFLYCEKSSWTTEFLPHGLFDYRKATDTSPATNVPGSVSPVVIFVGPNPADVVQRDEKGLTWKPSYYFMLPKNDEQQPRDGNFTMLERLNGTWQRRHGPVPITGGVIQLKEPGPHPAAALPYRRLAYHCGLDK